MSIINDDTDYRGYQITVEPTASSTVAFGNYAGFNYVVTKDGKLIKRLGSTGCAKAWIDTKENNH